jgi:hypothetical protein
MSVKYSDEEVFYGRALYASSGFVRRSWEQLDSRDQEILIKSAMAVRAVEYVDPIKALMDYLNELDDDEPYVSIDRAKLLYALGARAPK